MKSVVNAERHLYIFDFDDTLVITDTMIGVTQSNGATFSLTPGQLVTYEAQPGDKFDYSQFSQLINPRPVDRMCRALIEAHQVHGPDSVVILSGRHADAPIKQFLDSIDLGHIEVVALGSIDPSDKASWIDTRIWLTRATHVWFYDDSSRNVQAVKALRPFYPNTRIKAYHVTHPT